MRSKDVEIGMQVEIKMWPRATATGKITDFDPQTKMVTAITDWDKREVKTHIRNVCISGV